MSTIGKPIKHFFPIELRNIISAVYKGGNSSDVTIDACSRRKGGRAGTKLKKITFQFQGPLKAKIWAEDLMTLVYGGSYGIPIYN